MKRTLIKWGAAATAAAALFALTGCTGDDSNEGSDGTPTVTASASGIGDVPALDDSAVTTNDIQQKTCDSGPGAVSATGEITNSSDKERDMVVVVTWTSTDGSTVLATSSATATKVPAKGSWAYQVENTVEGEESAVCTVRADAGVLG